MIRLAVLTLLLTLSGCSTLGASRAERDLADARARWAAYGPAAYTMTQQRICFCPPEVVAPLAVSVRDGTVVTVLAGGAPAPTDRAFTVEGLFDVVADAFARGADEVRVSYDPVLGYPAHVRIDEIRGAVDDEIVYSVTDLTPAR